ncbi:MAG: M1 family metallopeptidase, partial [Clostridiales bacterium]|nr:M1 family metallopeptidase [Clostridiales bacterium]
YEDQGKTLMVLSLEAPWQAKEELVVELNYEITIPHCAHLFGYNNGFFQLGNVLVERATYENGQWRKEEYYPIGDPFYTQCANYDVTINVPKEYTVASSGYGVQRETEEQLLQYQITAPGTRNFGFTISNQYQIAQKKVGATLVTSYALEQKEAEKALQFGEKALTCFENLYGAYPYQQLTISQVDFPFGGMEFSGLVMIAKEMYLKDQVLEQVVAHEVAHQWWYGVVGSDQYYQPWQDEALCEYSYLQYIKYFYGEQAKNDLIQSTIYTAMRITIPQGVTPGSPLDYFDRFSEYDMVVYKRGAMLFLALEEALGEEQFQTFLRDYYQEYAFKLVSRQEFEDFLRKNTGEDWQALFTDYLDTEYRY